MGKLPNFWHTRTVSTLWPDYPPYKVTTIFSVFNPVRVGVILCLHLNPSTLELRSTGVSDWFEVASWSLVGGTIVPAGGPN
jgi:hypothetical protein